MRASALDASRSTNDLPAQRIESLNADISRSHDLAESINRIPVKASGLAGLLERPIKKLLKFLVHWNTADQAEFNRRTLSCLKLVAAELDGIRGSLSRLDLHLFDSQTRSGEQGERLEKRLAEIDSSVGELGRQIESLKVSTFWSDLERRLGEVEALRRETGMEVLELKERLDAFLGSADDVEPTGSGSPRVSSLDAIRDELDLLRMRILRAERTLKPVQRIDAASEVEDPPKSGTEDQAQQFDYFLFEQEFRGSRAEIKKRQLAYLYLFTGRNEVLDLGCGRGEFVELLAENGVKTTGVDASRDMVEFCRDRGLPVVQADASSYLQRLPDKSVGGIFASQIVEHLSFDEMVRLLRLCGEKLRTGGVLVVETVNTTCPEALGNFFLDPSHVRPVPPLMLRFLLHQGPFTVENLRFTSPAGGRPAPGDELVCDGVVPAEASYYMDYAVIARRG
jgi:O-antigen chain-terminating methyltransferase